MFLKIIHFWFNFNFFYSSFIFDNDDRDVALIYLISFKIIEILCQVQCASWGFYFSNNDKTLIRANDFSSAPSSSFLALPFLFWSSQNFHQLEHLSRTIKASVGYRQVSLKKTFLLLIYISPVVPLFATLNLVRKNFDSKIGTHDQNMTKNKIPEMLKLTLKALFH